MPDSHGSAFAPLRPKLARVAYNMLGSVADAEDVVQEAFMRWMRVDRETVREPATYLRRVVTRLCLDQLKSARRRHETYVGPWLPEPVIEDREEDAPDVTLPLLLALERLSPLERAAFLLHDVFGLSFEEVADTIGRKSEACRQLAKRARVNIRADKPRFPPPGRRGLEIAKAFFHATRSGDIERLRSMLAEDVVVLADGGGKTPTTAHPVSGRDEALRLHESLARLFAEQPSRLVRYGLVNGLPGFVTVEQGVTLQTTALEINGAGEVRAIYVVRNPEKLRRLAPDSVRETTT